MPYEAVRTSDDPRRGILAFLDGVYGVATTLGGWDAEAFTYRNLRPRRASSGRIASMTEG